MTSRAVFALAGLLLLSVAGCGPNRPDTVPVSGQVLFAGEQPGGEGMVYFTPLEPAEGFPRRPGRAAFGPDGQFVATTFEEGDGLMPGTYRVAFDCWDKPPKPVGPPSRSLVPPPYGEPSTSPLELEVEIGVPQNDLTFDLR